MRVSRHGTVSPRALCALAVLLVCLSAAVALQFRSVSKPLLGHGRMKMKMKTRTRTASGSALKMAVYSSAQGVPAALVEERDACGVGFIASLNNRATHNVVEQALVSCDCMEHRGATSSDGVSGDGAGILTAIPWKLFGDMYNPAVVNKDGSKATAVGMYFLPKDVKFSNELVTLIESIFRKNKFVVKGWRAVPVDVSVLGSLSADFVPAIKQLIVESQPDKVSLNSKEFDERLYNTRREVQGNFRKLKALEAYTCSLSSKTIVYKGMLRSSDLGKFFLDLKNPDYESSFAVYHRRFSTNTIPKWYLAQPMRMLAHNGEINTLLGNINWVKSRQYAFRNMKKAANAAKCLLMKSNVGDTDTAGECYIGEGDLMEESPESIKRVILGPLVDVGRSDSANLDSVLDSYVQAGFSPEEAMMILVPEAYESQPKMKDSPEVSAFYSYYESIQEAWDGPALLVFADGDVVGATLDRNGLRPARFMLTRTTNEAGEEEKFVHMMSEVGVTKELPQFAEAMEGAVREGQPLIGSGRLGPGEMLSVNLAEGKLYLNDALKQSIATKRPYQQWLDQTVSPLARQPMDGEVARFVKKYGGSLPVDTAPVEVVDNRDLISMQSVFGWGSEDVELQITAMASTGIEATYSMGDDAPLAALSVMPHVLFDYFKQRFAQVTNPAIDPLREGAVMSLNMFIGTRGDPTLTSGPCVSDFRVKIESPVLNTAELGALGKVKGITMTPVSTLYPLTEALAMGGLKARLEKVCNEAVAAVRAGANVVHLTDEFQALDSRVTYIPPLMAVGAVHHRLISLGLRTNTSIVVSTGQAWSTHHVACLVGYGASAVVPYAAFGAVINWHAQKRNQFAMEKGELPLQSAGQAVDKYRKALDKGLLKILSKMGISLLTSYHGAQIFEVLGLADDVVMEVFKGTPCRVSGLTFDEIAAETADFSRRTFGDQLFDGMAQQVEELTDEADPRIKKLFNYGFLNYFKSGDFHHNNIPLVKNLHKAVRDHDFDLYKLYEDSITSRPATTVRDTLRFARPRKPIPVEQVQSVESIMTRFCTGGMSLGALSREAHETLAIGMNRIGGKSNCGEGGEDKVRNKPIPDVDAEGLSATFPHLKGLQPGDRATSRIKQVSSGRFGVTPEYLMSADQIEIKIAQGAKPGEGGQLPGKKIDQYIATLRSSKPGVTLISPPPHHDIYSIEDLAQLIYDLHQINKDAPVSVKLVSEVGIGTVASGVAKAGADVIQVSGHDGGTGASPVSSIKNAGSPWELGLVETHAALLKNGLRDRVLLRVDGGMKSGWDVVMAAAMGAEEYGFGTIAMIAEGCIMARVCHTNKCPVGVTTQDEKLRKKFVGTPDNIVTFFGYVALEVRQILAELGYSSLEEMIALPGVIEARPDVELKKTKYLDPSYVLDSLTCLPDPGENFCAVEDDRSWLQHGPVHNNGYTFDDKILEDKEVLAAVISGQESVQRDYRITNTDRSAFARVSGQVAKLHGDGNFQGKLRFSLTGGAGQSFCALLSHGMEVTLSGYANDYVCKSMAGGRVVIAPPLGDLEASKNAKGAVYGGAKSAAAQTQFNVVGNTVLYGATGGTLMVKGRGGERFAVRNSGALGIVEGLGDHGCEYMTAGVIVNLGTMGRNFGAGMTGGLAFLVPDEQWLDSEYGLPLESEPTKTTFEDFMNLESVSVLTLDSSFEPARSFLTKALTEHVEATGSHRAQFLLAHLDEALSKGKIRAVVPVSEKENALIQTTKAGTSASVSTSASASPAVAVVAK